MLYAVFKLGEGQGTLNTAGLVQGGRCQTLRNSSDDVSDELLFVRVTFY